MAVQYTPVTSALIVVIVLSLIGTVVAWRQRQGPTERWGAFVQLTVLVWAGLLLVTVSLTTLEAKRWGLLLFLPVIPVLNAGALCFTAHFTGRSEWLTRRRMMLLAAYPLFFLLLAVTNSTHELLVTGASLEQQAGWTVLTYQWGPAFWLLPVIAYAMAAVYLWWLLEQVRHSRNVYRKLSFVILLANAAIVGATVPSTFQVSPLPHFLLVPYVYLLIGGLLVLVTGSTKFARLVPVDRIMGLVSSQFGDVVTLARDFVVEEVDNGILILDGDDRIVDVNSTAKQMLGVERPVGNKLTEVTQAERIEELGSLGPVLAGDQPVSELEEAIWLQTATGRRCYDVRVSALAADDDVAGHVVLLHDITEQKQREQRLRDREEELQAQKQTLQRQNDQLEHQNERLDQFASIVSHDLRNPLTVAAGYMEALEGQLQALPEDSDVDETLVAEVQHSHQRMESIIEDALTLARQGKAITETELVSLGPLAEEAWANVDTKAASLESTLDVEIEADRDRLLNVFENLFRNAIQHGREDVTVRCGSVSEDGETGFYVADDGPGIPESDLGDVLDHGYTTHSEGTGLGLSIVTDIVRAHGWQISVTNGAEGGARFEITSIERLSSDSESNSEAVVSSST
jgi:PAS domain S-box-containing protein